MTKIESYRATLRTLTDWDAYLLEGSCLPGPRANLELAQALALEGDEDLFLRYVAAGPEEAGTNTPHVFLVVCGVLGLGRLLAKGDGSHIARLRGLASDPLWRVREAVAMALQTWGDSDLPALQQEMRLWSKGTLLEQRAAAAALAEPRLLRSAGHALQLLDILDDITASISARVDRRCEEFRILRQALGYCWSVAVAALPDAGKRRMEQWFQCDDADVRWIMRENLSKKRLARLDVAWVERSRAAVQGS
ncbi:MAG TPA: hypothetical protein PKO09_15280 [Anaerolineae bacterium]|nr:hypothetical protein [Anaerolineae bacterium]